MKVYDDEDGRSFNGTAFYCNKLKESFDKQSEDDACNDFEDETVT